MTPEEVNADELIGMLLMWMVTGSGWEVDYYSVTFDIPMIDDEYEWVWEVEDEEEPTTLPLSSFPTTRTTGWSL